MYKKICFLLLILVQDGIWCMEHQNTLSYRKKAIVGSGSLPLLQVSNDSIWPEQIHERKTSMPNNAVIDGMQLFEVLPEMSLLENESQHAPTCKSICGQLCGVCYIVTSALVVCAFIFFSCPNGNC